MVIATTNNKIVSSAIPCCPCRYGGFAMATFAKILDGLAFVGMVYLLKFD
jgi:hypothetical protein